MSENEKNEQNEYAPLKGIKIVDWTQVQSGPSCTQLLAWLGADVIKIERTNTGDPTRNELLDIKDSWSLYYLQLNANKRSLTLDIKTPEGKKIMYDLAKKADVFVENIAPGSADRNGFGWEKLHSINPRLIYASLKGFNEGSRFENVKAFEPVAQAAGGSASATGWNKGANNVPTQSAAALGDSNTGMHLAIGWTYKAKGWETDPNAYVYIVIQNENKKWDKMCEAMGHPEWEKDPRFVDWQHRQLHKEELYPLIEAYTKQYDKYTLTKELGAAGVPVGPVLDWHELENDPDLNSDGTIVTIDQGGNRGKFKTIGLPFSLSNYKPAYDRAPDLGENNKEILTELGYDADQIEDLVNKGVISKAKGPKNPRVHVIIDGKEH